MENNPQDFFSKYVDIRDIVKTQYAKLSIVRSSENDYLYVKKSIICDKNLRDEGVKEVENM